MTFHCFAAEVQYHAIETKKIGQNESPYNIFPFIKKDVYESACRADLSTTESAVNDLADDYHELDSEIVQNQGHLHPEYPFLGGVLNND